MNEMLTAVIALSLQDFSNIELAAFNNAVQTFGIVPKENLVYKKSVELNLIKDNGEPFEIEATRDAAAHEVNRRVADGMFKVVENQPEQVIVMHDMAETEKQVAKNLFND